MLHIWDLENTITSTLKIYHLLSILYILSFNVENNPMGEANEAWLLHNADTLKHLHLSFK